MVDSRGRYVFLYDPHDKPQVLSNADVPARFPHSVNATDTVVLNDADVLLAKFAWRN